MELSDCNYGILQRNRARCALNKKILNLLALLEKAVVELVNRSLKYYSKFLCVHQHIIYNNMDTNTDHFIPCSLVCAGNSTKQTYRKYSFRCWSTQMWHVSYIAIILSLISFFFYLVWRLALEKKLLILKLKA